jgi:hypothetical protein
MIFIDFYEKFRPLIEFIEVSGKIVNSGKLLFASEFRFAIFGCSSKLS